jgi:predicted esterase
LAILFAAAGLAQNYAPGPQVVTFWSNVDDSDQPYGLYLPKNFDPAKQYPLVISLHGAYSNHRLNLRRVFGEGNRLHESDAEASRYFPRLKDVDFIVASAFARGTMGYQGIAERDVYDVLADVKRKFHIDEDRIYLTGLSMGGGGTLWLGLTRPDKWAAIAPVCAAAPPGTEDLVPNALNLPVHLFHGDADPVVPVEISRQWQKRLLDLGAKAEYVEFPGVKHNSWDYAYKGAAIFDWFAKFRRVRYPDRVRFVSSAYKYNSAYWVTLDGMMPGTAATVDARFAGNNKLEITTKNLDGFTLALARHPKYLRARPVSIGIDGQLLKLEPRDALSFSKSDNRWSAKRFEPPSGDKHPGAEGPLSDAIASRHAYIYGTGGAPAAEELQARRDAAEHAADWTGIAGRLAVSFPVHADKQMEDVEAESANLILFGTKETNSVIARLASHLPIELNAGAADYGLVFIATVGNHYVLVNSGLPWWTGAEHFKSPHFEFIRPPAAVLTRFGDYVLFKGSLENIVTEGRFDQHWKLTPADAEKMRATGAVVIK